MSVSQLSGESYWPPAPENHPVRQPQLSYETTEPIQEEGVNTSTRLSTPKSLVPPSSTCPDRNLLQFLLNDYVGGGQGNSVDAAVDFFKHYLNRYLSLWPEDPHAKKIHNALDNYIYQPNDTIPLTEAAGEIWQKLEQTGHLTMGGGVHDGDGSGHALFYEFILENGKVTLKVTNSGSGLEYHPKYFFNHSTQTFEDYYRTLVFSDASLQDLKQQHFLETLLSFRRKRPELHELAGIIPNWNPRIFSISDVYTVLFHGWPGKNRGEALNPGKAQRANSCSLQALMKWFKGECDKDHHAWLNLWIKLSAFSDYLHNTPEPLLSAQFIADASRKISTHLDKMDHQNPVSASLMQSWQEIHQYALEKRSRALVLEAKERAAQALSAEVSGLGLETYDLAALENTRQQTMPPLSAPYQYPHSFPNEPAPMSELPHLSQPNIANLSDEMAYRMNFLRLLPPCKEWSTLNMSEDTLEDIGNTLHLFFYRYEDFSSLQVPDSFFIDLLNAWMGIYLVAKKQNHIPKEVLFEWMRGASLLADSYEKELRFDSPQRRNSWLILTSLIADEDFTLEGELEQQNYEAPPNYWTVWNKEFGTDSFYPWMPFGIQFKRVDKRKSPIKSLKELPAMAHFAHKILQLLPFIDKERPGDISDDLWQNFDAIEAWDSCGTKQDTTIAKIVDAFGCRLGKVVPYFDVLKEGLGSLFIFADRHLNSGKNYTSKDFTSPISILPGRLGPKYDHEPAHPCLDFKDCIRTTRLTENDKPECILPKTEAQWKSTQDLNARIKNIGTTNERPFPFMTVDEEKELLIFIQKGPTARLPEMLVYFKKYLHKLSQPAYQAVFEHLLFSEEGMQMLALLFQKNDPSLGLLFEFFENSYNELSKRSPKAQTASAALFHSHLRLLQISSFYKHPFHQQHSEQLFRCWSHLLTLGKENAMLGKALGLAVSAAMPSLEFIYNDWKKHPQFLQMLIETCLLECLPNSYTQYPYLPIQVHYGILSLKELMKRHYDEILPIIQITAKHLFGNDEASNCRLDLENNQLYLSNIQIDLTKRLTIKNDEASMRVIPKELLNYQFEGVFGQRNFFTHVRSEDPRIIYAFSWKNVPYEFHVDSKTNNKFIYKKFQGKFYELSSASLPRRFHLAHCNVWQCGEEYLIEHRKTHTIIAGGKKDELYRYVNGKYTNERLASFEGKDTFLAQVFNNLLVSTQVWDDATTQKIHRIELPSLQMQFCRAERDGKEYMESLNFPGFFIDPNQKTVLSNKFRGCLVLTNSTGQKKVIAPLWPFHEDDYQPYEQKPVYSTTSSSGGEQEQHPYLIFDLESATSTPIFSPHPDNQCKITWMILFYLHTHEYRKALDLIEETRVTSQRFMHPMTEQIFKFFNQGRGKDTHPHAVAIRLRLVAWQAALGMDTQSTDLPLYDNLKNSMGLFALSPEELSQVRRRGFPNNRQKDLSGYSTERFRINTIPFEIREKMVDNWNLGSMIPPLSMTAPGEEFILNFFYYFCILSEGTEAEKASIKPLIYHAGKDSTPLIALLGSILLDVEGKRKDVNRMVEMFECDEVDFYKQFKTYLFSIPEDRPVKYSPRPACTFNPSGSKKIATPRQAQYIDTYQPLPSIPLSCVSEILPFKALEGNVVTRCPIDITTETQAVKQLGAYAAAQSQNSIDEPIEQVLFDRLQRGANQLHKELQKAPKEKEILSTDPTERKAALDRYQSEIDRRKDALQLKEQAILEKANNLHHIHQLQLEMGRELRTPFDIETLLIVLARKDLSAIKNCNPSLSPQEITEIIQEVADYALLRADLQQLMRASKSLQNDPEKYFDHARAIRCYDPIQSPELLVFEVLSDLTLREEQLAALRAMTPWTLFEARTGFGKSKVLLPLWLLLTAQEGLTVFTSPATLFSEQDRYLQELLKKAYRFFATTIVFSRNSPCSAEYIAYIENEFRKAEKLKRPVFMSDQTIHNLFVLKLKEFTQMSDRESLIALRALLSLRKYVKTGRLIVDEPQKVLDDGQEYNYSIGRSESTDAERLDLEIELYQYLLDLTESQYQVDFWHNVGKPPLTEEIYRSQLLIPLLQKMFNDASAEENIYLRGELDPIAQQAYEAQLCANGSERAMRVRLLHDQLHYYLPHTLQRHCNEHYALVDSEKERKAIPLEDSRNPRQDNEFVVMDQMLNFTVQANLNTPFSFEYVQEYVEELSRRAAEEVENEAKTLEMTEAYRQFRSITKAIMPPPSGLLVLKPEEYVRIHEHINSNFRAKLQLIRWEVLPKVRFFSEKVSSTPHLLVQCFDSVVGASGTLSMQHFPHQFTTQCDEKAIGKTLVALLKRNDPIVELQAKDSLHPLPTLSTQFPEASVMIEVGALLRHYPELSQIAQEVLQKYPHFKGFATFDAQGHPIVITRNSTVWTPIESAGIPRDQFFWFYGQKDITGRDEKLGDSAMAVVLVNQHTTLTQLIQGVGRLRGILNKQSAKIAIDQESSLAIRHVLGKSELEPLTLLDIVSYCVKREGQSNGLANFRSLSLQLDALIEQFFWDGVLNAPQLDAATLHQLRSIRQYIVQSTRDEPLNRPSLTLDPIDITTALEKVKNSFDKKVADISELISWNLSKINSEEMEKARLRVLSKMPYPKKVLLHQTLDASQTTETTSSQLEEVETTRQTTRTMAVQTQTLATDETETESARYTWTSSLHNKNPLPRTAEIRPHALNLPLSHPYLQERLTPEQRQQLNHTLLYISENALCTFEGDTIHQPGWVNGYSKPLHYIAQLPDERYVVIDMQEAEDILQHPEKAKMLWLINHGPLILSQNMPSHSQMKQIEAQVELLTSAFSINPT